MKTPYSSASSSVYLPAFKSCSKSSLKHRKQLHLTQEELAERSGITPQTVSSAELGKKALRPENIIRLCNALNISTDYLLQETVNQHDSSSLMMKMSELTPNQYRHLENIIDSYIAAIKDQEA